MPRERLLNNFGFPSNCFVCEDGNARGMRVPFYLDTDAGTVVADATLGDDFSGAPAFLHGGVLAALMDEGMAWAVIAVGRRFGVTRRASSEFLRPARVGEPISLTARCLGKEGRTAHVSADVRDASHRLLCRMEAEFAVLTFAEALEATETRGGDWLDYVLTAEAP